MTARDSSKPPLSASASEESVAPVARRGSCAKRWLLRILGAILGAAAGWYAASQAGL